MKAFSKFTTDGLRQFIDGCRRAREFDATFEEACRELNGRLDSVFQRIGKFGEEEFSDGTCWFAERYVCNHCREQRESEGEPYAFADEQYSLGIYAGRYCEECWKHSGYRKDGPEGFDPEYAGECYDENY